MQPTPANTKTTSATLGLSPRHWQPFDTYGLATKSSVQCLQNPVEAAEYYSNRLHDWMEERRCLVIPPPSEAGIPDARILATPAFLRPVLTARAQCEHLWLALRDWGVLRLDTPPDIIRLAISADALPLLMTWRPVELNVDELIHACANSSTHTLNHYLRRPVSLNIDQWYRLLESLHDRVRMPLYIIEGIKQSTGSDTMKTELLMHVYTEALGKDDALALMQVHESLPRERRHLLANLQDEPDMFSNATVQVLYIHYILTLHYMDRKQVRTMFRYVPVQHLETILLLHWPDRVLWDVAYCAAHVSERVLQVFLDAMHLNGRTNELLPPVSEPEPACETLDAWLRLARRSLVPVLPGGEPPCTLTPPSLYQVRAYLDFIVEYNGLVNTNTQLVDWFLDTATTDSSYLDKFARIGLSLTKLEQQASERSKWMRRIVDEWRLSREPQMRRRRQRKRKLDL